MRRIGKIGVKSRMMEKNKILVFLSTMIICALFVSDQAVFALTGSPAYYPTVLGGNTTGDPDSLVLGKPDDSYINIRVGEYVIYDFSSTPILNRDGQDFNIYQWDLDGENSDRVNVLVSSDGETYYDVTSSQAAKIELQWDEAHGDPSRAQSYDLSSILDSASFLKIICTQNPFNLDAVGTPVPIPNAAWLMGVGIVALVGLKRRKPKL